MCVSVGVAAVFVCVWVLQRCVCVCVGKMLQGAAGGKGASLKLPALFFGFMKNLNTHTKMAERSEAACSEQVASGKQHVARCMQQQQQRDAASAARTARQRRSANNAPNTRAGYGDSGTNRQRAQWAKLGSQPNGGQGIELGQAGGEFATCAAPLQREQCGAEHAPQQHDTNTTRTTVAPAANSPWAIRCAIITLPS